MAGFGGLFLDNVVTGGSYILYFPAFVLCLAALVCLYLCFAFVGGWWPAHRFLPRAPSLIPAERRPDGSELFSPHAAGIVSPPGVHGSGAVKSAGLIPRPAPGFQSRPDLLAKLDREQPQAEPKAPVVIAVTGMRGVGKTQLAAEYARAKQAAGWRLVAWVNAEDEANLRAGMTRVAECLDLTGDGRDQPGYDAREAVRSWLEADGNRCLIVFDYAFDPDMLQPFIPGAGVAKVLITTYHYSMKNLGDSVPVDVFTSEEAQEFLADQTGLDDAEGAITLAAELGFLPLALAQAGALIYKQRLSYRRYVDRLRDLPLEQYLPREAGQPYPLGAAEAIVLSLQAIKAVDQAVVCTGVLEFMAVLSAGGVRRDMLHDAAQSDMLPGGEAGINMGAGYIDDALGELVEFSLLAYTEDDATVVAHRLVMRVVRDGLAGQGRLTAVCQAAASVLNMQAEEPAGSWERLAARDFAEQVIALRESTAAPGCASDDSLTKTLLRLRLRALSALNDLEDSAQQAIVIGEPLTGDYEQILGTEHPDTLQAQNALAVAYQAAGRAADAIPLLKEVLTVREETPGSVNADILAARGNLAWAYQRAGLADEAIALDEPLLGPFESEFGPDHRDTLKLRSNLARCYEDAGRTAEAIPLFEQALAGQERVLGPDHPDTQASRSDLANSYREAGRVAEAIPLHEQILANQERMLPSDHPKVLASRLNLANDYHVAGRTAEAIPLFEQTLADQERMLGPDHPDTLACRTDLAIAYDKVGRITEMISLFEQTLAARERAQGPDNPQTLSSRMNLAVAYQRTGRIDDAIPLFTQVLAARERVLGLEHPQTQAAQGNLRLAQLLARHRMLYWIRRQVIVRFGPDG